MNLNRVIEIIENEASCVLRNHFGCDRDCGNCDLVLEDEDVLTAYLIAEACISYVRDTLGDAADEDFETGVPNLNDEAAWQNLN